MVRTILSRWVASPSWLPRRTLCGWRDAKRKGDCMDPILVRVVDGLGCG